MCNSFLPADCHLQLRFSIAPARTYECVRTCPLRSIVGEEEEGVRHEEERVDEVAFRR
jgi:hypothetical protein